MNPLAGAMARLRRRPVRVRLAIFSAAVTAVILIAFAAVVGRLVSDRLQGQFDDELRGTANALAFNTTVRQGIDGQPLFDEGQLDIAEFASANEAVIQIVDQSGTVYRTSEVQQVDLGVPDPGDLRDVNELEVADASIRQNFYPFTAFYVQYAQSPATVDKTIGRLWFFLACGVVVGTLLAAVAGMGVARRAMRPIANLTGTAKKIARTRDPALHIPVPENEDEVAELARTLEEMLRELDAARSETEATVQRQREFVADASHELRTPLTSILANLELLEEGFGPEDEDERAATRSALRSSRRMGRLVGDLLILARADAGRRGTPERCDLSLVAAEAFEEVHPVAEGHRMEADLEPGIMVMGDADELHRMVLNLLENAIRHTPEGTSVDLELRRRDADAVLCVADDGPGLPEGAEEKVFGRFVRAGGPADRQGRNGDGTGLGLAIVKAVANAHGGEASAGAGPAGGARFEVVLPLAPPEDDDPDAGEDETEGADSVTPAAQSRAEH